MERVSTIKKAAEKIRELFQSGLNSTHYFILELNGKEYQIRVSDHSANGCNNRMGYDGFFSFISKWCKQPYNMMNEYKLDEDGDFTDQFLNIEECLDWNIN